MNAPIDAHARAQAVDISGSYIVSAPAGSGKTGLLTLRVLKLLSVVKKPEEILCITFTRKAAFEMHERIFGALQHANNAMQNSQQQAPTDAYQKEIFDAACAALRHAEQNQWHLLESPYRLNISTIDGFCKSLCNALPFFSGLGAEAAILDNPEKEYAVTVNQWLIESFQTGDSAAVDILVKHLSGDLERLQAMLVKLLSLRDQWLPLVVFSKAERGKIRQYFETTLQHWVDESIQQCRRHLALHEGDLCELIHYAQQHIGGGKQAALIAQLAAHDSFPEPLIKPNADTANANATTDYWRALAQFCLTTDRQYRKRLDKNLGFPAGTDKASKLIAKEKKTQLLRIFSELQEAGLDAEQLATLLKLPDTRFSDAQWHVLDALFDILPTLAAKLKLRFIELGEADFTEYSLGAVAALNRDIGDMELLQRLDYRIQHVLIDEFQDTSQVQLELLQALTQEWLPDDGRSLFLVGDGMQSCYSFRNANVGIFLNLREHGFDNIDTQSIDLNVNFRSSANIVNWVNSAFAPSLPEFNDANLGAVSYIPSNAFRADSAASHVRCIGFNKSTQRKPEQSNAPTNAFLEGQYAEAKFISAEVNRLLNHYPDDSIAVLAKSRKHLECIIAQFQYDDVPYQAVEIDALVSKQHIVDLISLTKLLLEPDNSIAFLALLRSPFCGLNHADLFAVFNPNSNAAQDDTEQAAPETTPSLPIDAAYTALETQSLSENGALRLRRFLTILSPYLSHRLRRSMAENIETLWLKLGGGETLTLAAEAKDVETYIDLIRSQEHNQLIEDWPSFEQMLSKLYASPDSDAHNPVQLMTMHKSKGLEFDSVFLPSLEKGRRSADTDILYWLERLEEQQSHFILSPIAAKADADKDPLTEYIKYQRAQKTALEDTRVFYVACTRAKQRLYLSASLDHANDGNWKAPPSSSLLGKIWPSIAEQVSSGPTFLAASSSSSASINQQDMYAEQHSDEHFIPAFPLHWQTALLTDLPEHEQGPTNIFDNTDTDVLSECQFDSHLATGPGNVFHRIMQKLCENGIDHYSAAKVQQLQTSWLIQLRQEGVGDVLAQQWIQRFVQTIDAMREDETARWVLDAGHSHSKTEWALSTYQPEYQEHIIDRSFIDGTTRWVIDYKTSTPHADQSLSDFVEQELSHYREQLLRYRSVVSEYDKANAEQHTAKEIRVALYFPLIKHLEIEANFDLAY